MKSFRDANLWLMSAFAVLVMGLGFVVFRQSPYSPQQNAAPAAAVQKDTTYKLSILFAGDVMQHSPQLDAAYNPEDKQYYYDNCFRFVKPLVSNYDLAIANLETTFGDEPYSGYPMFCSPDNLGKSLANAGFDILATSNNHCADRGGKGIQRTIDIVEHFGMEHTGTFKDTINRLGEYPLIVTRNNIKLALLNYTYDTNGMPVTKPYIANLIDTAVIAADLKRADLYNPDYKIVYFHWGIEYQRQPSAVQRMLAKFCFEHGADLVIGGHPHVIQPIEEITYKYKGQKKTGVVYWSLGNYISNQRNAYTDGGIMAHLELVKDTKTGITKLVNYGYIPAWVNKNTRTAEKKDYFIMPSSLWEQDSTLFEITKAEKYKFKQFTIDTRLHLKNAKEIKFPMAYRTDTATFNHIKARYKVQALSTTDDLEASQIPAKFGMNTDTLKWLCNCEPSFTKEQQGSSYVYSFVALPTIENARKIARKFREYGADRAMVIVEYR